MERREKVSSSIYILYMYSQPDDVLVVHLREEFHLSLDPVLHSRVVSQLDLLNGIHPPVQEVTNLKIHTHTHISLHVVHIQSTNILKY